MALALETSGGGGGGKAPASSPGSPSKSAPSPGRKQKKSPGKSRKAIALEAALKASEDAMAEEQRVENAARHAYESAQASVNRFIFLRDNEPFKPKTLDELYTPLSHFSPDPLPPHKRGVSLVVLLFTLRLIEHDRKTRNADPKRSKKEPLQVPLTAQEFIDGRDCTERTGHPHYCAMYELLQSTGKLRVCTTEEWEKDKHDAAVAEQKKAAAAEAERVAKEKAAREGGGGGDDDNATVDSTASGATGAVKEEDSSSMTASGTQRKPRNKKKKKSKKQQQRDAEAAAAAAKAAAEKAARDSIAARRSKLGRSALEQPTHFVTYSRNINFELLIKSLAAYCVDRGIDVADVYIWLDVLSLNHHKEAMGSSFTSVKECITSAKKVISSSRTTLIVLDPWNTPSVWQRSWCLCEYLEAWRLKRRVDFCFALDQRGNFIRALLKGYSDAEKAVLTGVRKTKSAESRARVDQGEEAQNALKTWALEACPTRIEENIRNSLRPMIMEAAIGSLYSMDVPESIGISHPSLLDLARSLATYLTNCSPPQVAIEEVNRRADVAEEILRRAAFGCKNQLGPLEPSTTEGYALLAGFFTLRNRLPEAVKFARKALSCREKAHGLNHEDTLKSGAQLAGLLKMQYKFAEAEPLYRRVMSGASVLLGATHEATLAYATGLAMLLAKTDRPEEAEKIYRSVLAGWEERAPKQQPSKSSPTKSPKKRAGDDKDRVPVEDEAVEARFRLAMHLDEQGTATAARAKQLKGAAKTAAAEYAAVAKNDAAAGVTSAAAAEAAAMSATLDATTTAVIAGGGGDGDGDGGDGAPAADGSSADIEAMEAAAEQMLDEAEELYTQVVEGRTASKGEHHLDTLACVRMLAALQEGRGNKEEAVGKFQLLVENYDEQLGAENIATLRACMQTAAILRQNCPAASLAVDGSDKNDDGDLAAWQEDDVVEEERARCEVEKLYRRCLASYVLVRGEVHRDTVDCCFALATFLEKQRGSGGGHRNLAGDRVRQRTAEAEAFYRRALAGNEALLGATHASTLCVVLQLGDFFESQKRFKEAEQMYRRLVTRMEATPGPWHPDTYNAINNLALLLAKQGRVVESEALYRRALEGLQTQRGPDHFDTLNALWNLGLVVDSLGTGNQQTSDGAAGVRASRSPSDYDREAEEVFSKAVDGFLRNKGSRHADTRGAVAALAEVLRRRGKRDAALALFEGKPEWNRARPAWI